MADWTRAVLFSVAIALFLGLVGAFGTIGFPVVPRMLFFGLIGVGDGLAVALWVTITNAFAVLRPRPLLRRAAAAIGIAPTIAVWTWLALGYAFMHGPR